MSKENVEVVRRVYKLAEARGVEGLLELATDDIGWISDSRFPGGGTYVGKENVRRWSRYGSTPRSRSTSRRSLTSTTGPWALPGSTGSIRMPLRWTGRGATFFGSEMD